MRYCSLNNNAPIVDFKEATLRGLAPDKGLYFPENIPEISIDFLNKIEKLSKEEIAFEVIKPYIENSIPEADLRKIVEETIGFEIPLVGVTENVFSLELFHGPTLAFKDVGARFMSRCLGYFVKNENRKVTVLVATSGDTGGAVANGFYDVDGVEVVILFPAGKVSLVQEKQLTTLGKNIHALEVNGNFDDCQQMVKAAFSDEDLNKKLFLTSANSINVARWLPQQFYYFFAWKQWKDKDHPPVISVPSGNFGNICAGILASFSGLPVKHFVAACNANDVIPAFLQTEKYQPKETVATISNAMDVGDPSNFVRILQLFNNQFSDLKNRLTSYSISDQETRKTISSVFENHNYLLDPHGAVAFAALKKYLHETSNEKGIFLETAHPVKFYDVIEPVINQPVELPESLKPLMQIEKKSVLMEKGYDNLKEYLLSRNS
jgi:threonine synthase